ncbi:MAG: hypothetical protein IPM54_19395 [Polyangiaceae bacterium]|nr:hypothetical protein [Polyangiaceae bacterium]
MIATSEGGTVDDGQVRLETAIGKMDRASMEVRYRVTNGLEWPILLLTPLPQFDEDTLRGVPGRVYTYVDPEGILHITKRLWLMPDDIDVVVPEVPFATEVLPRKAFSERFTLSLPVKLELPYLLEPEEFDKPREELFGVASGVVFSVGYLSEEHGPLRFGPADPDSGASLTVRYGVAAENQRILEGGLLRIGVPVKDLAR